MTEPTMPAPSAQEPTQPPTATPPWGADFDAEKAWNLVENLRKDKEKLASRPALTAEQTQQLAEYNRLVEASKTEQQRLTENAETARRDAEQARTEATRYKVAATYGIGAEHFDLLGSGDEEAVSARAEKLAALIAGQATPATPPPVTPTRRPVEQLRPGATPAQAIDEDEATWQALGLPTG